MSTPAVRWPAGGIRADWTLSVEPSTREESGRDSRLSGLDDRRLVELCLGGRVEAFDVIVERHQRAVFLLCYRFTRTREDAADLTQEAFLRAYRGLRRFRGDATFSTWLYRIGVNVCLNHVSARRPPHTPIEEAPPQTSAGQDPAAALLSGERAARVRRAVARLPRKQRATLLLRVYHDLSHQEIATALGTSVGAAKANFFHALENLKKFFAEEAG